MVALTFPDGARREYPNGISGLDIAKGISPSLAKRRVATNPQSSRSQLIQMSALTLINATKGGGGTQIPEGERKRDIAILDIYGNAASVRARMATWIDYMHLAKWNGRWVIVNVLWENDPQPAAPNPRGDR